MNRSLILLALVTISWCTHSRPSFSQISVATPMVYIASTPCDNVSRSLLHIPPGDACDWIRWNLALNNDSATSTFNLKLQYGLPKQGSRDFMTGSKFLELKGRWTADADGFYTLVNENPRLSLSLWQPDKNILYLLDNNRQMIKGNGAWSYLLNRVHPETFPPSAIVIKPTSLPVTNASSLVGIFEGRTPCNHIVKEFYKVDPQVCFLTKWRLTLFKDSITQMPTHFKLETLYVGTGNDMHVITGKWVASRGTKQNPSSMIYQLQLDPAKPESTLTFMKGDDNILFILDKNGHLGVGDDYSGYVLTRRGN